MATSNTPRGRGRGRGQLRTQEPDPVSSNVLTTAVGTSITSDVQITTESQRTVDGGRGRARSQRAVPVQQIEVPDPYWIVSDLSMEKFQSNDRPPKPTDLGTIGQPISIFVNYFPIRRIPQEGFIYQYDIEIRNKRDREIGRDRRR